MSFIAHLVVAAAHFCLYIKHGISHLLVYLFKSPFRWKTERRHLRYELSYLKYR